jgi:heptosyltransferase-2
MSGAIDVIETNFSHGKLELSKRRALAKIIWQQGFDDAIILPNSWKSILIPWLAKIPRRYGYEGEFRSLFLTTSLPNPSKLQRPPMVEHYLALASIYRPDLFENSLKNLRPSLNISEEQIKQVKPLLEPLPNSDDLYILAPGAEYGPAKQWPSEHFAKLAEFILNDNSMANVVFMGSPKDVTISQQITQQIPSELQKRILNLCGKTTLDQSIALLAQAKALASNDSGMMHIGAAFGIPQVAFYGSSDPNHTPPLSPFAGILFLGLDCSPCHQRKCPLGHLNCLKQITPESALTELNQRIHQLKAI